MPVPIKEMVDKKSLRNQDPIHREQQRLFIFIGQLYSIRSQIDNTVRNSNSKLSKPLDLRKFESVSSQLSIEIKNLTSKIEAQMKNLKEIVGTSDETRS